MWKEYAVDPTTVASSWQNFRYVFDGFGLETGRLICKYPKKWERTVIEHISEVQPIRKARIIESLTINKDRLTGSGRQFVAANTWVESAEAAHQGRAFDQILADKNPRSHSDVTIFDDVQWGNDTSAKIQRTVEDLSQCCERLLRRSGEILFIDPHFNGDRRFNTVIFAMLDMVKDRRQEIQKVEVHLNLGKNHATSYPDHLERTLNEWKHRNIPEGFSITFFVWDDSQVTANFHARYVLTECGSISFDHGLDEGEGTTDVHILNQETHSQTWEQYQEDSCPFSLIKKFQINR
jgi:hypothetical protein